MQSPAIKQALGILRQLRQITENNIPVSQKLSSILETITGVMQAAASTCYVSVDDSYLELFSTYGFAKDA